jgi:hypothetical protein
VPVRAMAAGCLSLGGSGHHTNGYNLRRRSITDNARYASRDAAPEAESPPESGSGSGLESVTELDSELEL